MTFLKNIGHIEPQLPRSDANQNRKIRYYTVELDLATVIEGFDLRFEVRWPPGTTEVRASYQMSIASEYWDVGGKAKASDGGEEAAEGDDEDGSESEAMKTMEEELTWALAKLRCRD